MIQNNGQRTNVLIFYFFANGFVSALFFVSDVGKSCSLLIATDVL